MTFSNVRLGDNHFEPSVNSIMADTGTSLNMIPDEDYYKIFDMYFKDKFHCQILPNTLHSCDCTLSQQQAIPDIEFNVGSETYSIPRDKWFERSGNQCVIKFMHGPAKDYWILGLNFFENYYTVFDYDNMQIGFADSINKGKYVSNSFINWATGKDTSYTRPALMNLVQIKPHEHLYLRILAGTAAILCGVYCFMMRKATKGNKVRAQVEQE